MSTEVMIFFGVSGLIVLALLKAVINIIQKFIELADKLGMLIEVTYQATHDPDFGVEICNNKPDEEDARI